MASLIVAVALVFIVASARAQGLPGPLVSVQWLHAHRGAVTVLGIRAAADEFTRPPRLGASIRVGGHIPGARLIALGEILATRTIAGHALQAMPPSAGELQNAMRRAGVDGGKPFVIVSAGDGVLALDFAARLYWTLQTYGARDLAILNGGMAAWLAAGYPASTEPPQPAKGNWTATKADLAWFADSEDVARAVAGDGVQLVDARPTPEFLGITKVPIVRRRGHIPGARSFPPDALVRHAGPATYFMSAAQYRLILPQLGIDAGHPTIAYCNTGIYSAAAWFVLHAILGNPDTRLYVGSMQEWTAEGRPVVP